jgi:hypothetical protein
MKSFYQYLLLLLFLTGCRKDEAVYPFDEDLIRAVRYNSTEGIRSAHEDLYHYGAGRRLKRVDQYFRDGQTGERVLGRYQTYTYDSRGRLTVKMDFSRLKIGPWYSAQQWRYTYPAAGRVVETSYLTSTEDPAWEQRTSFSETLLENNQPRQVRYFTRDSLLLGTYRYTYSAGRKQSESYFNTDSTQSWRTTYTYQGRTVEVETQSRGGLPGKRRQTLDERGRVVRDEVVYDQATQARFNRGPDVYLYEYAR